MESSDEASLQRLVGVLAEWDVPCPGCSYSLRGLRGPTCPECGERLELRVGVAEPRLAGFITGLLGLATGVGFGALITVFFFIARAVRGGIMDASPVVPAVLMFLTGVAGLWAWIGLRARVRRLPAKTRGLLVVGCWVLTLLLATWFFVVTL